MIKLFIKKKGALKAPFLMFKLSYSIINLDVLV